MPSKNTQRGRSRVRRHTYDIDDPRAQLHAPLGGDGTLESSALSIRALLQTVRQARQLSVATTRYGQGFITRVAQDALEALLKTENGFDHWSGTNDLAGSQIARAAACSKRQWQRVKQQLADFGIISFVHRSVRSGLDEPGVDRDVQISDLYSFTPERLLPWLREIYDAALARLREQVARKAGLRPGTPLVKRDRPHRRIPALLNPAGWARLLAQRARTHAGPAASYAAEEARALAFATQLAAKAATG